MAFTVVKKLDLSFLGEGWTQGTYLKFSAMTFSETREFAKLNPNTDNPADDKNLEIVLQLLQRHLIEGRGWDGQNIVEIKSEDLTELPPEVVTKAIELLAGTPDPKSPAA